jgi:phosphate transport system protein
MPDQPTHILGNFQRALDDLGADIERMSELTMRSLDSSIRGLTGRDTDLCSRVIADDEEIDRIDMKIDEEGIRIIVLFQPVASDLRKVVSAMNVSSNLERVADQAAGIAKRARKMNRNPEVEERHLVVPLYEMAARQIRMSLDAYRNGDVETALRVRKMDRDLDKAYKATSKQLTRRMEEDREHIKDYLDLQFIIRFLERIGDHAKNISEDAVFAEAAVDIRHGGAGALKQDTPASGTPSASTGEPGPASAEDAAPPAAGTE